MESTMVEIKTESMEEIRARLEQDGVDDYGEYGFGDEVVRALKKLGAKNGDEIQIFYYWDDENGAGTVNGKTFYEESNNNRLRFIW